MRITLDKFKFLAAENSDAAQGLSVSKALVVEAKADETDGGRTIRVRASTAAPDRDNDTISVHGWDLGNFVKNGPFLWAHDSHSPPVGRSIRTWVEDEALKSVVQFPTEEEAGAHFAFADSIYRLYKAGYLNAVSVGFSPKEWVMAEARGEFAFDFKKQELLEISAVPVPANPEALIEARKSIDLAPLVEWAEKVLDGERGPGLWIPVSREKIELARKSAKASAPMIVDLGASSPPIGDGATELAKAPPPAPAPVTIMVEVTAPAVVSETAKASGVELEPNFWKKIDAIVQRSLDSSLTSVLTGRVD